MSEGNKSEQNNSKNRTKSSHSRHHKLVKRPPVKQEQGEHIIYVNSSSNLKALASKCNKLIHQETQEIVLYCMGAAIKKGILLALQVVNEHKSYQISANTFTTQLTDDLEPATDEADYEIQHRLNSALKVRLMKKD